VVLAVVLGWALLGKVIPGLFPDGGRVARLRNPIGYWNALALAGDVAVLLGLWLATRPERVSGSEPQTLSGGRVRLAGALLVYGAIVTVALTYSRAAVVVGVLVVGAWFLLARPGLDGLGALILAGTAATVVAGVALALPGVSEDGQPHDARVRAGLVFGLALLAGAAFVWVAGSRLLRHAALPPDRAHALARRALVATGIAAALVLVALVVRAGGPGAWLDDRVDDFTDVQVQPSQGPERIGSFSSGNRWTWWKEAWHGFADNPVEGTGAGSFGLSHRIQRRTFSPPTTEPHNVALQFLSETGLIGFLLAGGAAGAAGLAVRSTLRSLPVGERAAALPLALGTAAYGLHSLVDFHWDFVAVTGPVLLVLGALATAGRPPAPVRASQPVWAAGAGALALAAVFSVTSPWLAERKLDQALEALGRGDVTTGIERAKTAHELNPLRLDPLLVWASAATARRDLPEAKRLYRKAVRLQPKNADAWYEFGVFELEDDRFPLQAYRYLNRSYTLDRFGPAGRKGGALDRARAAVNRAATRPKPRPRGRPSAPPP
jgi:O-antigen ligase